LGVGAEPAGQNGSRPNPTAGNAPRLVAVVPLPTSSGLFQAHAYECTSGYVYVCLVRGTVTDGAPVLTRVHSECLTGDALGSLRCDCGVQLRLALRTIAAEGRGAVLYVTGHEGRGIGLIDKLQAYMEQDCGADTVDANLRLGHAADARDYDDAAAVLGAVGIRSVRLLTNNPAKASGLAAAGVVVTAVEPLHTAPHVHNLRYLRTKETRLGHLRAVAAPDIGDGIGDGIGDRVAGGAARNQPPPVDGLLGSVVPRPARPYVALKFAQTVDGRIASGTGDAKWISSEAERRISHALRAACDAVLVGVGTVLADDPQLTVRLVPGASPVRVVLDSALRLPLGANVLSSDAPTLVVTSEHSDPERRRQVRAAGAGVRTVPAGPDGVDLDAALAVLRSEGIGSLLVEGGGRVITSMVRHRVADRLVVAVAPTILGTGTDAVGELGVDRIADAVRLTHRTVHVLPDDILLAWDVAYR
jgi:3,4-dihydroxy 2-butanone 4-phosphate synthase/GTP cyclohydrolase II